MKQPFFFPICIIVAVSCSLASCSKKEPIAPSSNTGTFSNPAALHREIDPATAGKEVPKIQTTIDSVSNTLKEDANYRACIARSTKMCDTEAVSRFSQDKESDDACKAFNDESMRNACMVGVNTELAKKKKDVSFCARLSGGDKTNCEQQAIIEKAKDGNDMNICNEIGTGGIVASQCVTKVLLNNQTELLGEKTNPCDDLKSASTRAECNDQKKISTEAEKDVPTFERPSFQINGK